jgi:hypothetical protein
VVLVFQYGSNCLDSQLNGADRLRGDAVFSGIARLDDYELTFDVWSKNRGCAASNIVQKVGALVWGALYQIPDHLIERRTAATVNRKSLDAIEGEGTNYERRIVQVRRPRNELIGAVTYTVIKPKEELTTNLAYASLIVAGLRERGVDASYIDRVKAIAIANNPAIALELGGL